MVYLPGARSLAGALKLRKEAAERNDEQYHITRLDVAFDDHMGMLDLERLYQDAEQGYFVSKMKAWDLRKSNKGISIYHGSE